MSRIEDWCNAPRCLERETGRLGSGARAPKVVTGKRHSVDGRKCSSKSTKIQKAHRNLCTKHDVIRDALRTALVEMGVQMPFLAGEIMKFVQLYGWSSRCKKTKEVKIVLQHDNSIAANLNNSFGAVVGQPLEPTMDHIVNVKLKEGVEFGIGACNPENEKMAGKRDFMCEPGGWGYYNYRVKGNGKKPKYPPGWYAQTHTVDKRQKKDEILTEGDVMTMLFIRELPQSAAAYRAKTKKWTIRFYKNGVEMPHFFKGIKGPLRLCCNFYFMKSSIQILSDYRLPRKGLEAIERSG